MNTSMFRRWRAGLAMAAIGAAALVAGPVLAAGGVLQAGSTVCTDWLRTDGGGVYLRGYASGSGSYEWTMYMSDAPGAAETAIFRTVTREITRNVVPPRSGTLYFRNCLVVRNAPAHVFRLNVGGGIGQVNPVYGIGPHVATLAPGSRACGEFAMGTARVLGASNVALRWSLGGTDLEYGSLGDIFETTQAAIDQVFDPGPAVFSIDACATNTSASSATVSFELLDP